MILESIPGSLRFTRLSSLFFTEAISLFWHLFVHSCLTESCCLWRTTAAKISLRPCFLLHHLCLFHPLIIVVTLTSGFFIIIFLIMMSLSSQAAPSSDSYIYTVLPLQSFFTARQVLSCSLQFFFSRINIISSFRLVF